MIQRHGIARLKKYIIMGCYGSKLHILNIPLCVWLTKTKKDKNKVLQTTNECYILKKYGVQGYQIWYFLKKYMSGGDTCTKPLHFELIDVLTIH